MHLPRIKCHVGSLSLIVQNIYAADLLHRGTGERRFAVLAPLLDQAVVAVQLMQPMSMQRHSLGVKDEVAGAVRRKRLADMQRVSPNIMVTPVSSTPSVLVLVASRSESVELIVRCH